MLGPRAVQSGLGLGFTRSQGTCPDFYQPHVNVGLATLLPPLPPLHATRVSVTPPLLLGWVNVASLNPWLLDFHTV